MFSFCLCPLGVLRLPPSPGFALGIRVELGVASGLFAQWGCSQRAGVPLLKSRLPGADCGNEREAFGSVGEGMRVRALGPTWRRPVPVLGVSWGDTEAQGHCSYARHVPRCSSAWHIPRAPPQDPPSACTRWRSTERRVGAPGRAGGRHPRRSQMQKH